MREAIACYNIWRLSDRHHGPGKAMNFRISFSVLMILAFLIFFFTYTETGALLLKAMGFHGL